MELNVFDDLLLCDGNTEKARRVILGPACEYECDIIPIRNPHYVLSVELLCRDSVFALNANTELHEAGHEWRNEENVWRAKAWSRFPFKLIHLNLVTDEI